MIGSGIGSRMTGEQELAERRRLVAEYEARRKAGYPCGTHTLYRKRP